MPKKMPFLQVFFSLVCAGVLTAGAAEGAASLQKANAAKKEPVKENKFYEIVAGKLSKEPVIDGVLEDVWQQAARIEKFTVLKTIVNPKYPYTAYVGYDENNLFVAFDCKEPDMAGLVANVKENGGNVTSDDCVELFLDVRRDRLNYIHFAVNPEGFKLSEKGSEPGQTGGMAVDHRWAPSWEVKTSKGTNSWICEMKIPFKELGIGIFTTPDWGFNLVRRRQQHGRDFPEYSGLTFSQKFFNFPSGFFKLTVGYNVPRFVLEDYKNLSKEIKLNSEKILSGFSKAGFANDYAYVARKQMKFIQTKLSELDKKTADIDWSRGKRGKFIIDFKDCYISFKDYFADLNKMDIEVEMVHVSGSLNSKFGIAVAEPGKKVILGEDLSASVTRKVKVSLAKNEYEGFQLVLLPLWTEIPEMSITVDNLKAAATGAVIDKSNIVVSPLGAIKTKPTGSGAENFGWNYDVLLKGDKFPLRNTLQPVWVSIYAPKDAKAGVYTGSLRIFSDGTEKGQIGLTVEVFDFALPEEPSLKTAFYFNDEDIRKFYSNKPPPEEGDAVAATLAKHRLNKVGNNYKYPEGEDSFNKFCQSKGLRTVKIGDSSFPITDDSDISTPGFTLDHPYVDNRIMFWFIFKANLKDALFYKVVTWAPNTVAREKFDPMSRIQMVLWDALTVDRKNGEGNLIYPKGLSSVRLEYVRDGLEDYEYFKLLKDLLQTKRLKLTADDIKSAENALDFSSIISGETAYSKDIKVLLAKRAEIAKMIVLLQTK